MNVVKGAWFSALLILIAGIVLCFLFNHNNVLVTIVYIVGALFTATGAVNVIVASSRRSNGKSGAVTTAVGWIAGLGGIGLGAVMLISPHSFTDILVYVFAIALILAGLWHFFTLSYSFRPLRMPGWLYFLPLIVLVGGVVILCSTSVRENVPVSVLMTGIGGIIFAVTTFLEIMIGTHMRHKADKEQKKIEALSAQKETETDMAHGLTANNAEESDVVSVDKKETEVDADSKTDAPDQEKSEA